MNTENAVLRKWIDRLPFPAAYTEELEALLADPIVRVQPAFNENPQENLLTALYRCEELEQEYRRRGFDDRILTDTASDIVLWVNIWYDLTGTVGLMETAWLERHFTCQLFRLGRLQFCMGNSDHAIPDADLAVGDPILEVHIPAGEPMGIAECRDSIDQARRFFATHFPEYRYHCFTCHSWLLDPVLATFLNENANIIQFQHLFHVVQNDVSDAALKYIFHWNTTREDLPHCTPASRLASAVRDYALGGGALHESLGWFF